MAKQFWCVGWLLVFMAANGGCGGESSEAIGKLVVTGSSTVAPLVAEIAKRFEQHYPHVRIDVQTGGSSRGISDVRRGLADVGMVSRAITSDEADLYGYLIALDGVCVIVHRDNPVRELTDKQIIDIYTGAITNWRAVSGRDTPIVVVNKAEGRSTLEVFLKHFRLASDRIKASVIIGDNQQGIKTVAGNPAAIGYVSIGAAQYEAEHAASIKILPMGGVAGTVENVSSGLFPLVRPLNLITNDEPIELARQFIEFACSDSVRDLVMEQYFVALSR